ncbi:hypothetical protein E2C01_087526 [Portunus trituberculatus]|uniref:Uncharacterized protein n=1 Tax=Portunus trituberculatus TaxID=210409 RepID=A0A5B7JGK8_PORTR|nr:hypothetical protein [Portunus trituberculatus]
MWRLKDKVVKLWRFTKVRRQKEVCLVCNHWVEEGGGHCPRDAVPRARLDSRLPLRSSHPADLTPHI